MLSNEMSEIDEMALFLQDLATKFGLRHFTIKMRRHSAIKRSKFQMSTAGAGLKSRNEQNVFVILAGAKTEDLGEEYLDLNDIENITFLTKMAQSDLRGIIGQNTHVATYPFRDRCSQHQRDSGSPGLST
jgi:hypothetical protein